MPSLKTTLERIFLAVGIFIVLIFVSRIFVQWREGRLQQKEVLEQSRVQVLRINPVFPPAMLIEFDNPTLLPLEKVRFQAVFEIDGHQVAQADREYENFPAEEKKTLLLQSLSQVSSLPPGSVRVKYRLLVFPFKRKSLAEVTGEFELK